MCNLFPPDYALPPGESLLETLEVIDMSQTELAECTGRPKKTINEIIKGRAAGIKLCDAFYVLFSNYHFNKSISGIDAHCEYDKNEYRNQDMGYSSFSSIAGCTRFLAGKR